MREACFVWSFVWRVRGFERKGEFIFKVAGGAKKMGGGNQHADVCKDFFFIIKKGSIILHI